MRDVDQWHTLLLALEKKGMVRLYHIDDDDRSSCLGVETIQGQTLFDDVGRIVATFVDLDELADPVNGQVQGIVRQLLHVAKLSGIDNT